jgi:hypothetical protein
MKKIIGTLLILSCVTMLAACGKIQHIPSDESAITENSTTTEESATSTEPKQTDESLPSVTELSSAMQEQFSDMHNFTVKMYVSTEEGEYSEDDKYMVMADGDGVTYSYIANYLETYTTDDTVYYYDETQQKWFTDTYDLGDTVSVEDEADTIKNQVFPETAEVSSKCLNGTEYIAVAYEDTDDNHTKVVYYFTDDLEFVAASSEMLGATEMSGVDVSYLYMTLSLDGAVIPDDVKNAEKGNFEEYQVEATSRLYDLDGATTSNNEE